MVRIHRIQFGIYPFAFQSIPKHSKAFQSSLYCLLKKPNGVDALKSKEWYRSIGVEVKESKLWSQSIEVETFDSKAIGRKESIVWRSFARSCLRNEHRRSPSELAFAG